MALADFLGNVGSAMGGNPALSRELAMNELPMPGPITGFGGGTFGMDGQQVTPQMPQQAPPQAVERPGRKKGVRHFLGVLGDALLVGSGADPIYGPSVERAEMGEALAGYLGTTDAALADIMRRDPATGLALLKMKMESAPESQDPTALMQNMEYLRRLNPGMTDAQLAEVAQYAIAPPRMYGSPEMGWQPDPNYPFARGALGGKSGWCRGRHDRRQPRDGREYYLPGRGMGSDARRRGWQRPRRLSAVTTAASSARSSGRNRAGATVSRTPKAPVQWASAK